MSDDLKAKLNAKGDAERTARANSEESGRRYKEAVLREYPRLVRELHERVKTALDGVKDAKIGSQQVKLPLTYMFGSTETGFQQGTYGTVDVPEFVVTFGDRRISFHPAGTGYIGFHGKIEVRMTRPNPLYQGALVMVSSRGDESPWKLATVGEQYKLTELDDRQLSQLLEQA